MQVVVFRTVFVERILLAPIAAVRRHFDAEAGAAYACWREIEKNVSARPMHTDAGLSGGKMRSVVGPTQGMPCQNS